MQVMPGGKDPEGALISNMEPTDVEKGNGKSAPLQDPGLNGEARHVPVPGKPGWTARTDAYGHQLWGRVKVTTGAGKVKDKHRKVVMVVGMLGWIAKGIVYAIIGGQSCKSAVGDYQQASPQGAFILLGSSTIGRPSLIVMAGGLAMYITWRFWEAITGQGTDPNFSKLKNFFKFRLSPFISGCVYCAYLGFLIQLIPKTKGDVSSAGDGASFTKNWSHSAIGKFGLALMGVAFTIAAAIQLQGVFTRYFHWELKESLPDWFWWIVVVLGHIGFTGRFGVFLFAGILFFRQIGNGGDTSETTISNALNQLRNNKAGKGTLFVLGFMLIIYGTYAVLCGIYAKQFPTPPPTTIHTHRFKHHRHHKPVEGAGGQEVAVPPTAPPLQVSPVPSP